jgi:hypothetical protein
LRQRVRAFAAQDSSLTANEVALKLKALPQYRQANFHVLLHAVEEGLFLFGRKRLVKHASHSCCAALSGPLSKSDSDDSADSNEEAASQDEVRRMCLKAKRGLTSYRNQRA